MVLNLKKMTFKKLILRAFLGFQIIFFLFNFLFSSDGIFSLRSFKLGNVNLFKETEELKDTILELNNEIQAWKDNFFYKEKIARENLQMANSGDEIYILV